MSTVRYGALVTQGGQPRKYTTGFGSAPFSRLQRIYNDGESGRPRNAALVYRSQPPGLAGHSWSPWGRGRPLRSYRPTPRSGGRCPAAFSDVSLRTRGSKRVVRFRLRSRCAPRKGSTRLRPTRTNQAREHVELILVNGGYPVRFRPGSYRVEGAAPPSWPKGREAEGRFQALPDRLQPVWLRSDNG